MQKQISILLVEDNPSDVWALQLAIEEAGVPADLKVLPDGKQALAYIEAAALDMPDLLILDLNLPYYSGHEVLERWNGSTLRNVPALIVTSSDSQADRSRAKMFTPYYFRKPLNLDEFLKLGGVVKSVLDERRSQQASA